MKRVETLVEDIKIEYDNGGLDFGDGSTDLKECKKLEAFMTKKIAEGWSVVGVIMVRENVYRFFMHRRTQL